MVGIGPRGRFEGRLGFVILLHELVANAQIVMGAPTLRILRHDVLEAFDGQIELILAFVDDSPQVVCRQQSVAQFLGFFESAKCFGVLCGADQHQGQVEPVAHLHQRWRVGIQLDAAAKLVGRRVVVAVLVIGRPQQTPGVQLARHVLLELLSRDNGP